MKGAYLKKVFPDSVFEITKHDLEMIWEGDIQPSLISNIYRIRVIFSRSKKPVIRVITPTLKTFESQRLPHTYSHEKQELCLYYPDANEWNNGLYIAKTILPWTSEWLLHYEIWSITGEWQGGGKHPNTKEKKEKFSKSILKKL